MGERGGDVRATRPGRHRLRAAAVVAAAGMAASVGIAATAVDAATPPVAAVRAVVAAPADWTSFGGDPAHQGLAVSPPAARRVTPSWTVTLDGDVYGQPLVVGTTVVVATENDTVYALSARTGRIRWSRHLATPVPGDALPCGDIDPSGITGTPVASVALGRVWAVTFDYPAFRHVLWGLNLATGRVVTRRVVDGPGSDPRSEQERGALGLFDNRVYVPFGGLDGDCSDYHGWVVGAPVSGHGPLVSYVTPTQREAGIWEPPGVVAAHGSLYVATGNGSPVNAVDNSDSVLRLSPTLQLRSSFTPVNYQALSAADLDLGTMSPVVLPRNQLFMGGKQGVGYLLGAHNLRGVGGQLASTQVCEGIFGGGAVTGETVVVSCYSGLTAVRVTPGGAGRAPSLHVAWEAGGLSPGPPVIAGGLAWTVSRYNKTLYGVDLRTGAVRFAVPTGYPHTSFPSLSVSGRRLFVPEGDQVGSYLGA